MTPIPPSSNLSIVVKDGKYFIFYEVMSEMGGTSPAPFIQVEAVDETWSDQKLGTLVAECLAGCSDYQKFEGWNAPDGLDMAVKKVGYKSYSDLRRGALWIYVEGSHDKITIYPSRRHGTRSPAFEGLDEVVVTTGQIEHLGEAIRTAVAQSR